MIDFLAQALERDPDSVAVDDGRESWTYGELGARSREVADRLRALGAEPGRLCVVTGAPSLDLVATLHGAFRTGACVAPLHPDLTRPERIRALSELRPALVVGGAGWAEREAGPVPEGTSTPPRSDVPSAAAALWTSGTSGSPRAVLVSEDGLRASAAAARDRLGLGPDDRWYASLAPAHVGGLALLTRAALLGSTLVVRGAFSVHTLIDLAERGDVTHASLVPTMLLRLLDRWGDRPPPASMRCLLLGGARTPPALVRRATGHGWPIALSYGLTEATSQVATATPSEVAMDAETLGRPLRGVAVRIADSGEILVRGPTVSPGTLDGAPLADADGWLATGDLGELDGAGRLRVTGRRTDRIMTGG
ncbi:MAG: AMP-binding protein, partial [Gemmatimonadetes bacterium]|nr:AMP-binding protein [Gemmatimonadota bacterium]